MAKPDAQPTRNKKHRPYPTEPRNDEELFLDYRDHNDEAAFDTLVQRYERELYGYLRRYLRREDLAEDVFQSSFVQLHRKRDSFEEGRRFRPWLYSIATHLAVDLMRSRGRRRAVSLDRPAAESETGSKEGSLEIPSKSPGPLAQLEAAEQRAWVRNAVEELPEHLRSTVILAFFQGLKYEEIAETLEIPLGTVKSRINSAMKRLTAVRDEADAAERGAPRSPVRSGRASRRAAQSIGCGIPLRAGRRSGSEEHASREPGSPANRQPVRKVLGQYQGDFSDVRVPRHLADGTCEKVRRRVESGSGRNAATDAGKKFAKSENPARTNPVRGT